METAVKRTGIGWNIEFEVALAEGVRLVSAAKAAVQMEQQQAAAELAALWLDYDAEVRAGLPEVLQPLMTPLRDEEEHPAMKGSEDVLLDGEAFGLAPILAKMVVTGGGKWEVSYYLVMGIYETGTRGLKCYGFSDGDEFWVIEPVRVGDVPLALGLAHDRFMRKVEMEGRARQARAEEVEYVPDSQEPELVAEKALVASVRAIVRDEIGGV